MRADSMAVALVAGWAAFAPAAAQEIAPGRLLVPAWTGTAFTPQEDAAPTRPAPFDPFAAGNADAYFGPARVGDQPAEAASAVDRSEVAGQGPAAAPPGAASARAARWQPEGMPPFSASDELRTRRGTPSAAPASRFEAVWGSLGASAASPAPATQAAPARAEPAAAAPPLPRPAVRPVLPRPRPAS